MFNDDWEEFGEEADVECFMPHCCLDTACKGHVSHFLLISQQPWKYPSRDALYWQQQGKPTRQKNIQTAAFNSFCSIFLKPFQLWRSLLIQCLFVTTEKLRMGLLDHKPQTTKVFTGLEPWAPAREGTQKLLGSLFSIIRFYKASYSFFYSKHQSKE